MTSRSVWAMRFSLLVAVCVVAAVLAIPNLSTTAATVDLHGRALGDNGPLHGTGYEVWVRYWNDESAGSGDSSTNLIAIEKFNTTGKYIDISNGLYNIPLGGGSSFNDGPASGTHTSLKAVAAGFDDFWITLDFKPSGGSFDGETSPRIKPGAVTKALRVDGSVHRESLNIADGGAVLDIESGSVVWDGDEYLIVGPETASTIDTLVKITNGSEGDIVVISPETGETIIVQHDTDTHSADEIVLAGGRNSVLDREAQTITLRHNGTYWVEKARNNGLPAYIQVVHKENANTHGGTIYASWKKRPLSDELHDAGGYCDFDDIDDTITLSPGTYRFSISACAYNIYNHQIRLYNFTAGTVTQYGSTAYAHASFQTLTRSVAVGMFYIEQDTEFEIQDHALVQRNTDGRGRAANFGDEYYTFAEFWKVD